jgi:hypothetical protein
MEAPAFKYLLQYEIDFHTDQGKELSKLVDDKIQGNCRYRSFYTKGQMCLFLLDYAKGMRWSNQFKNLSGNLSKS